MLGSSRIVVDILRIDLAVVEWKQKKKSIQQHTCEKFWGFERFYQSVNRAEEHSAQALA